MNLATTFNVTLPLCQGLGEERGAEADRRMAIWSYTAAVREFGPATQQIPRLRMSQV